MSFSPQWLALRESHDLRARNTEVELNERVEPAAIGAEHGAPAVEMALPWRSRFDSGNQ